MISGLQGIDVNKGSLRQHSNTSSGRIPRSCSVLLIVIVPHFIKKLIVLVAVISCEDIADIVPLSYYVVHRHTFIPEDIVKAVEGVLRCFSGIIMRRVATDSATPELLIISGGGLYVWQ